MHPPLAGRRQRGLPQKSLQKPHAIHSFVRDVLLIARSLKLAPYELLLL